MKKLIIFIMTILFLSVFQNSFAARQYMSYVVEEISSEGLVVKDSKGEFYLLKKDPGEIKVGDLVRYDYLRNRLKKSLWQFAEITEMTNGTMILRSQNSGEMLEIRMRSSYRGKFNEGEQVLLNESKGQVKKSRFEEIVEE